MTTTLARGLLFLSSYSPLPALVAIRVWDLNRSAAVGLLGLAVILVGAAWLERYVILRGSRFEFEVSTAEPLRESSAGYLVAYVLPFLLVDLRDSLAVIASVVFVGLMGVIYVRSRLIYLNPLVALDGYVLWKLDGVMVASRQAVSLLAVARKPIDPKSKIWLIRADQDLWFVRGG